MYKSNYSRFTLKYVLLSDVVPPQGRLNRQQTPKPLAQDPDDEPPIKIKRLYNMLGLIPRNRNTGEQ